jgi:hypothetical protein
MGAGGHGRESHILPIFSFRLLRLFYLFAFGLSFLRGRFNFFLVENAAQLVNGLREFRSMHEFLMARDVDMLK